MKLSLIGGLTFFLSLLCITSCYAWDFTYSYKYPTTANAQKYIIKDKLFNVECTDEGFVTYWKPKIGGPTKDFATRGEIIYHFSFDDNVKKAFLNTFTASYHWSYSQGHTYLYASTDGIYWTKLIEAAPPEEGPNVNYAHFKDLLPEDLLHKKDIYLKAVLYSYGSKAHLGGAYTNTAQHSRYQHGSDVQIFELYIDFDRWLLNPEILDVDKGEIATFIVPGRTYEIEQIVINPTENTVKAQLSYSLPVSSGDNKDIGQSDVHLEANTRKKISTQVRVPLDTIKGIQKLTSVLRDSATKDSLDVHNRSALIRMENIGQLQLYLLLKLLHSPEE